ncbi:hypothetical protein NW762_000445 [Fusarium torreyae]|uniref:Uncharacterized protein n=1 Tax=Fusarium torreyae TaxID=1237075 RepID=A0A9W8SGD1_9HYPO|nr:hypothetical protein NW762_000445 [Fusarium torreyae]
MSTPSSTQELKKLPTLPTEVILKILKENTEKQECWIHLLSEGKSPCGEGLGQYSTVIYTRGQKDEEGKVGRGHLEGIPLQHKCIFNCPVADGNIDFKVPHDESWELTLEKHRLTNQLHVYHHFIKLELLNELKHIWDLYEKNGLDIMGVVRGVSKLDVLGGDIMNGIPFSRDLYGGLLGSNREAYLKSLSDADTLLECQRRRHIMIRATPFAWPRAGMFEPILDQVCPNMPSTTHHNFRQVLSNRHYDEAKAVLEIEWSLMSGLESLCIDLSSPHWLTSISDLKPMCIKTGKHLKLKTIVIFGLSARMDYRKKSQEFWVETLEDNEQVQDIVAENDSDIASDISNDGDHFSCPTLIFWFKECLQPGGQLHLIHDHEPWTWTWTWNGPDDSVFTIEDDGTLTEVANEYGMLQR